MRPKNSPVMRAMQADGGDGRWQFNVDNRCQTERVPDSFNAKYTFNMYIEKSLSIL